MRFVLLILVCFVCCSCQTIKGVKSGQQDLPKVLSDVKKSFNMQDAKVSYCPVCGKHYSGHLLQCPDDKAKLVPIE